jgi:hypothetical protein
MFLADRDVDILGELKLTGHTVSEMIWMLKLVIFDVCDGAGREVEGFRDEGCTFGPVLFGLRVGFVSADRGGLTVATQDKGEWWDGIRAKEI